jgi:hypothetical protein
VQPEWILSIFSFIIGRCYNSKMHTAVLSLARILMKHSSVEGPRDWALVPMSMSYLALKQLDEVKALLPRMEQAGLSLEVLGLRARYVGYQKKQGVARADKRKAHLLRVEGSLRKKADSRRLLPWLKRSGTTRRETTRPMCSIIC